MNNEQFKKASLLTAIKTPYKLDGRIDLIAFNNLAQRQLKAGVEGLVVCGTTGEGHLLNWKEHLELIKYTAKKFGNKLLVIGNTGSNSTKEALRATKEAFDNGSHICLQINPYYGKTSQSGVIKHLELALDLGPCIIYNVPSRTAQDIEPFIIKHLSQHHNFIGVKECAGPERIELYEKEGIACWSGNDGEAFISRHQKKAHGVISVAANIIPNLFRKLMDENDPDLNKKILPFTELLFVEPNPIPLNTILAMLGLCLPVLRMPYLPLEKKMQEKIKAELSKFEEIEETINLIDPADFKLIY